MKEHPLHRPRAAENQPPRGPSARGESHGRKQGAGGRADRNQQHVDIALKLPGIGKEAVIDINSYNEEIGNYISYNVNKVGHQVQHAFTSGTHYY